jgi:hypothetical protein
MRKTALVSICAVVVVTAYYYATPRWAVRGLESAIRARDAAALDERVDFSRLRENLKGQLSAMMVKETAPSLKDNPLGALATGFASILVGGVVESLVTPDGLAALAAGSRPLLDSPEGPWTGPDGRRPTDSADPLFDNSRLRLDSPNRFSVWVPNNNGGETRFVFARSGLSWRLTSIFLPTDGPAE